MTSPAVDRGLLAGLLLGLGGAACAADTDEELQKKLANPIADRVTVPFQSTTTLDVGPLKKPQHTLNIQPVYPMVLSGGSLFVNRLIVPVLSNPAFAPAEDRRTGLGDITYEAFFVPPGKGGTLWGFGPIVQLKTASDDRLGSGKWSAGPAAIVFAQPDPWSVGVLLTQRWSFAGDDDRASVSQMEIQPIASYRLGPRHSIAYTGIIAANWHEPRASQRWTVPLGATYSILTKPPGFVPVNYIVGGGYNVIRPDTAGTWFLRVQVNFVLAK